jgi:transcriptional regulator of acetoin/glycerol metabolism
MKRKTYSFDLDDDPAEEPAPKGHPGLVLLFARGVPAPERVFVMLGNVATVGREPGVDLLLAGDDAVSERHARLTCQDGRLRVADLGSHNGVYVGATRVTEAELAQDDVLRFGGTFFKVTYRDAAGHADYALDGTNRADTREEAAERRRRGFAGGYGVDRLAGDLARVAKTGVTVLLEGESGTGKEVFARYVHQKSERPGAFVTVNTSAIAAGLVESELFGAVKGAYSGATQDRKGLVREAHRGTLFLDEIGDMPLEAQSKLLRVLQEREVLPVGASRPEPVDLRVVAATHRDLRRLLVEGKFRGDLYGRLSECQFVLPPLRERKEDLLPLCRALLDRHKRPDLTLSASFVGRLLLHSFPFNVRELEHVITRALALLRPGRSR